MLVFDSVCPYVFTEEVNLAGNEGWIAESLAEVGPELWEGSWLRCPGSSGWEM